MAGEFIWNNSPDCISRKGDFQDIPLWRDFNYQMLKYLHENYSGTIIVPMTLINKKYYSQIIDRLITDGISYPSLYFGRFKIYYIKQIAKER